MTRRAKPIFDLLMKFVEIIDTNLKMHVRTNWKNNTQTSITMSTVLIGINN